MHTLYINYCWLWIDKKSRASNCHKMNERVKTRAIKTELHRNDISTLRITPIKRDLSNQFNHLINFASRFFCERAWAALFSLNQIFAFSFSLRSCLHFRCCYVFLHPWFISLIFRIIPFRSVFKVICWNLQIDYGFCELSLMIPTYSARTVKLMVGPFDILFEVFKTSSLIRNSLKSMLKKFTP